MNPRATPRRTRNPPETPATPPSPACHHRCGGPARAERSPAVRIGLDMGQYRSPPGSHMLHRNGGDPVLVECSVGFRHARGQRCPRPHRRRQGHPIGGAMENPPREPTTPVVNVGLAMPEPDRDPYSTGVTSCPSASAAADTGNSSLDQQVNAGAGLPQSGGGGALTEAPVRASWKRKRLVCGSSSQRSTPEFDSPELEAGLIQSDTTSASRRQHPSRDHSIPQEERTRGIHYDQI
jgi:hypothetical protein